PGAHRALGRPGRGDVARHEIALRGGRQARSGLDPARPYRRGRGGRKPRGHVGLAADAHGQRHPNRGRWRPGEVADGSLARPQVSERRGWLRPPPPPRGEGRSTVATTGDRGGPPTPNPLPPP